MIQIHEIMIQEEKSRNNTDRFWWHNYEKQPYIPAANMRYRNIAIDQSASPLACAISR